MTLELLSEYPQTPERAAEVVEDPETLEARRKASDAVVEKHLDPPRADGDEKQNDRLLGRAKTLEKLGTLYQECIKTCGPLDKGAFFVALCDGVLPPDKAQMLASGEELPADFMEQLLEYNRHGTVYSAALPRWDGTEPMSVARMKAVAFHMSNGDAAKKVRDAVGEQRPEIRVVGTEGEDVLATGQKEKDKVKAALEGGSDEERRAAA